jgi:hypothetical protein
MAMIASTAGPTPRKRQRRQHERDRDRGGAARTGLQVAEPHRDLGGQRPGHRLADREALLELPLAEPAAPLDKVAVHVAHERNRPAEPGAPQPQEVHDQAAQRPLLGMRERLGHRLLSTSRATLSSIAAAAGARREPNRARWGVSRA